MSLLMDALKKAELAKRQSPQAQTEPSVPPHESLELTPIDGPGAPQVGEQDKAPVSGAAETGGINTLPELPSTLELLDQEFMDEAVILAKRKPEKPQDTPPGRSAAATPASGTATPSVDSGAQQRVVAETQRDRASIQNLFEAKQSSSSARKPLALIGLIGLLAAAGIGIYFWLQLQPKSSLARPGGPVMPISPARPAVAPALPVEPVAVLPEEPKPAPQQEEEKIAEIQPAAARQAPPPAEIPIRVTKSKLQVDPAINTGFDALQNGDLAGAKAAYEQSLKNDPKNADALHGLANIQLRLGKPDVAQDYYLRALEADPKDALAQASLISMSGQIDPVQSESRLKLLLAAQSDSTFLHFYLGNLYARQNRWAEAQQEYFKTIEGEPENPDYLFNLAVSLDQLHQPRLAAQYYARALGAADKRSAGFDKQQVSERLKKLQP